jgi:hypothetical protein
MLKSNQSFVLIDLSNSNLSRYLLNDPRILNSCDYKMLSHVIKLKFLFKAVL